MVKAKVKSVSELLTLIVNLAAAAAAEHFSKC